MTSPWAIGRRYVMHVGGMELWGTVASVTENEIVLSQVIRGCRSTSALPRGIPGAQEPEAIVGGHYSAFPEMIISRRADLVAALWDPDSATDAHRGPYR